LRSWSSRGPAFDVIAQRIPQTLWVLGFAFVFGIMIAIPVGVISAYKQYSWFDNIGTFITMVGYSVPTFFTHYFLGGPVTIAARATAMSDVNDTCVWALDKTTSGAVSVSGSSQVTFECGVLVNSKNSSAISQSGESCLTATKMKVAGVFFNFDISCFQVFPNVIVDGKNIFLSLHAFIQVSVFFIFAQKFHRFAGFRGDPWPVAQNLQSLLNVEGIIELKKILHNQCHNHAHGNRKEYAIKNPQRAQIFYP
jgi:hypothetical protein